MPKRQKKVSSYDLECDFVQKAVVELQKFERPNLSKYCRDRAIPDAICQRIRRALKGNNNRKTRPATNTKLSAEQDLALERFCDKIDDVGFGVTRAMVTAQADALLAEAHEGDDEPPRVGVQWASRWLASHTKYYKTRAKPIDLARKLAQDPSEFSRKGPGSSR